MSRTPRLLAAFAASALVLAACGGDDDAAPATTAETTTTEAETTTTVAETTTTAAETTTTVAETTTTAAETTTTVAESGLGNLLEVAAEAGDFTLLLAAVEAAGLTADLETRNVTVLAPTDEAIEALGPDALAALLADSEALTALINNHLLPLPQTAEQIGLFNNVLAVGGASWPITFVDGTLTIGDATVIAADVEASNGYIQVIDTVLIPATEG